MAKCEILKYSFKQWWWFLSHFSLIFAGLALLLLFIIVVVTLVSSEMESSNVSIWNNKSKYNFLSMLFLQTISFKKAKKITGFEIFVSKRFVFIVCPFIAEGICPWVVDVSSIRVWKIELFFINIWLKISLDH